MQQKGRRGADRRPAPAADLPELLRRAQADGGAAMQDLLVACRPHIVRIARYHVGSAVDFDDVVQEVSIILVRSAATIHSPEFVMSWLKQVTARVACSAGRRSKRIVVREAFDELSSDDCTEDVAVDRAMLGPLSVALRDAIGRLRPADQHLLALLAGDDSPNYQAISEAIGRPIGSIGPTRQRLLARLRKDGAMASMVEQLPVA